MSKGGYNGGSTVVGPGSGWFNTAKPKPRQRNKFVQVGDALAQKWKEQRQEFEKQPQGSLLISKEDVEAQGMLGKPSPKVQRKREKLARKRAASDQVGGAKEG